MLTVSRFARIFLLALVLVTVPTAFIFYPSSPDKASGEVALEQGGVDSEHWREPVPPPPPEAGGKMAQEEMDEEHTWTDGAALAAVDNNVGGDTGAAAPEGGKAAGGAEYSVPLDVVSGAVIMPHLGNATAK